MHICMHACLFVCVCVVVVVCVFFVSYIFFIFFYCAGEFKRMFIIIIIIAILHFIAKRHC